MNVITRTPNVCVLRTDGTNCDGETAYAFAQAGAEPHLVHVNQLRSRARRLKGEFQILALPGGFSYGDDVASGKILAVELISFLGDELREFIGSGGMIIGICNGFQVLVRTGLLPFGQLGQQSVTLAANDSGKFECRWVNTLVQSESPCVWVDAELRSKLSIAMQVAHGEGKFWANPTVLQQVEDQKLVVLRYACSKFCEVYFQAEGYPDNPNGSLNEIAGICDPTGRIFGLMPHPERNVQPWHNPDWRTYGSIEPDGRAFFESAVRYCKQA